MGSGFAKGLAENLDRGENNMRVIALMNNFTSCIYNLSYKYILHGQQLYIYIYVYVYGIYSSPPQVLMPRTFDRFSSRAASSSGAGFVETSRFY